MTNGHLNDENRKNTILIVDDEPLNLTALTHILSPLYKIFASRDGMDAIETAKVQQPDLILLDIIMPDIDGFDVLARLKNMDDTKDIPVIFITGLANHEDEEKGLFLGAADYINKPFADAIVKLRVNNQMRLVNQMRTIRRLSATDPLTGTANRRHFNEQYEKEWRRNMRDQLPISLMVLDLDMFKDYNDTYGHLQGDVLLKSISDLIKRRLNRPLDMLARWGGEEFVILLPDTDSYGAMKIAEAIRHDVENEVFESSDKTKTKVTISIGVSCTTPEPADGTENVLFAAQKLFACADEGVYKAKQLGRNKVCYVDYAMR